jgi:hypothetical protein
VAIAAVVVVLGRPEHAELDGPSGRADGDARAVDRVAAAGILVERMQRALSRGDVEAARALGGSGSGSRLLGRVAANVERLGITRLQLRFVDVTSAAPPVRFGDDAWGADVQVAWQLRGRDREMTTVDVPFALGTQQGRATFLGVDVDPDYRVPLWLTGRVAAAGSARTLAVATSEAAARRLDAQARAAVRTVTRTLPAWRGQLVIEAPPTQVGFEAASGLPESQARGIAAVTTTTEPSGSPRPPVHVYLNPAVFDPLGPRGQQIVVSHEATHVAVGAANTNLPLWLSEGFADYVALRFSPLPETVLGAQITSLVRKEGAPEHLPGTAEFDGSNPDVGAWYEGAWIAVDLLGEKYGTERLLRFYREAERSGVERAFRTVLGTSEQQFERTWAAHLETLAS